MLFNPVQISWSASLRQLSLAMPIAVVTLLGVTRLPAEEPAATGRPVVSLERRSHATISLQAPSASEADQTLPGRPLRPISDVDSADGPRRSAAMPLVTIGSSLAVVLGLFAALVWVSKKSGVAAHRGGTVPDQALQLLGQKSLGTAGSIALVRCGRRVLVVGLSSSGMQSLAEITDAEEVRHLESLCLGTAPTSFREVLGEVPLSSAAGGFANDEFNRTSMRRKLFAEG